MQILSIIPVNSYKMNKVNNQTPSVIFNKEPQKDVFVKSPTFKAVEKLEPALKKTVNPDLPLYAYFPKRLEKYLAGHPEIDINSKTIGGMNLGRIAIESESLEALQLLSKRDDYDWNTVDGSLNNILTNLLTRNAIDKKFFNDVLQLLLALPEGKIDINSKDRLQGQNLGMRAIKDQNIEILNALAKRDDYNWNAVDHSGDNLLMMLIKPLLVDEELSNEQKAFFENTIQLLLNLPEGKFFINYINKETDENALSTVVNMYTRRIRSNLGDNKAFIVQNLLKFPNIDVITNPQTNEPLIFEATSGLEVFELLLSHPDTPKELPEGFDRVIKEKYNQDYQNMLLDVINKKLRTDFVKNAKEIYENNGFLTLEQIEKFVNHKLFGDFKDTKFNVTEENIAHLLADIDTDSLDIKELKRCLKIVQKLKADKFDFNQKDILGRTPLDKAIELQREDLIDIYKLLKI